MVAHDGFELCGAVLCGVVREDAVAGALANLEALGVGDVAEDASDVVGIGGDEDLFARLEELFEADPRIGEDSGGAGGGLEEADGGRPAGGDHVVSCEVQGEARGGIEGRVIARGDVDELADVGREGGGGRVLWAGDEEVLCGIAGGGAVEEMHEFGLAIGGVGAEVAEIAAELRVDGGGTIGVGIDGAVEGDGAPGAEAGLEFAQGRAAGEAEIGRIGGDERGVEIGGAAGGAEMRKGDGGVDVVEEEGLAGAVGESEGGGDGVGEVGADDDDVGVCAEGEEGGGVARPVVVEMDGGEGWLGHVAIAAIPLDVFFDEVDLVAAAGECAEERSIGGGVAVAPGRGDGEAVEDEFHRS